MMHKFPLKIYIKRFRHGCLKVPQVLASMQFSSVFLFCFFCFSDGLTKEPPGSDATLGSVTVIFQFVSAVEVVLSDRTYFQT